MIHVIEDLRPEGERVRDEILVGLRERDKRISCKFLYDARGAQLFERICSLESYYLTRCELAILHEHGDEIAREIGGGVLLVEYGSGRSEKTRVLLDRLEAPAAYQPIDISLESLRDSVRELGARYPGLELLPVCADFTSKLTLPQPRTPAARRVVFIPGSTIGNFTELEATRFLAQLARQGARGDGLLIGVDLRKPRERIERAYDEPEGLTAAFIGNVLSVVNRECGVDLDPERFSYRMRYDEERGRVEMGLVSLWAQTVRIDGVELRFGRGEYVQVENSQKYSLEGFRALAVQAGWSPSRTWYDPERLFSVHYLTVV